MTWDEIKSGALISRATPSEGHRRIFIITGRDRIYGGFDRISMLSLDTGEIVYRSAYYVGKYFVALADTPAGDSDT